MSGARCTAAFGPGLLPQQRRLASGLMSAAGLIAAVRSTDAGSSVSATSRREQVQQNPLLDHLVGAAGERQRDGDAERLGGFEIQD
jgi:hypothetical protein